MYNNGQISEMEWLIQTLILDTYSDRLASNLMAINKEKLLN